MVINELNCAWPSADVTHDENFANIFESRFHVSSMQAESLLTSGTVISYGSKHVDQLTLAKRCSITHERAKNTIRKTTQWGVRTCLLPSIARRFPTNNILLYYNRLPHTLFTDTLLSVTPSFRLNSYGQVFASSYGWSHFYPMHRKFEAREA